MDLLAYAQIDDLSKIAEANGICVPRLRGYRLMSLEQPMTPEEIKESEDAAVWSVVRDACNCVPPFSYNPFVFEYSSKTKALEERYLSKDGTVRWDRLHGKRRKLVKFLTKKKLRMVRAENAMWNRYAGKPGVLYIHTRCGGGNWEWYGCKELEQKPWYLDRVDDWFDGSYCTIYARVELPTS